MQAIGDLMGGLLDKQAAVLAGKKELAEVKASMATKSDLGNLEERINQRMDEGFEAVMQGMDNLAEELAEKEKVEKLVQWAREVGQKVGVKVKI